MPSQNSTNETGSEVIIQTPAPSPGQKNTLQLMTFNGITITPTPAVKSGGAPSNCAQADYVIESNIIVGSDPGPNTPASSSSNIRVWVTDEGVPYVAPGLQMNTTTGQVTSDGTVSALDENTDGNGNFSFMPTLYVYPSSATQFTCNAVNKQCPAHYPTIIKGEVNIAPDPQNRGSGTFINGPAYDPDYTKFENGPATSGGDSQFGGGFFQNSDGGLQDNTAEFIWPVSSLGLKSGNYDAQFVIHDGDTNMGEACLTITI